MFTQNSGLMFCLFIVTAFAFFAIPVFENRRVSNRLNLRDRAQVAGFISIASWCSMWFFV